VPPAQQLRKYEPNRQQLPESSYTSHYPLLPPRLPFPSQEPIWKPLPDSDLCVKASSYRQEFGPKSPSAVQFEPREMDCTRNKIKYSVRYSGTSRFPSWRRVASRSRC
jgi:hypothetical protein